MARRAGSVLFAAVALLWGSGASCSAWAQAPDDASAPLDPSESSCLGLTLGSRCHASTTTAGGTCIAGCCCHYVTDPEGTSTCAPCLACTDTANLDPAFSPEACSDAGAPMSDDAGVVVPVLDAGAPVVTPAPPPSPTSSTGGGCSGARAVEVTPSLSALGLVAFAALAALRTLTVFRRRARSAD